MKRSISYLCRGLLGIAVVGSLGFGTIQALPADDPGVDIAACPWLPFPSQNEACNEECRLNSYDYGICAEGRCRCYYFN
jgi:hypothetical protein